MRSRTYVFNTSSGWSQCPRGRVVAGIVGSNPAEGMDVCLLCLYVVLSCVGRGLCDGLITRSEEYYRESNCVLLRNLKKGGQGPIWAVAPLEGRKEEKWLVPVAARSEA
jgi:hypothetical protein